MPAYNAESYISQAIKSVLNQTYEDFELIIINDGSTDSTKSVINSFYDSRIKYSENVNNSGIVTSRNKGLVQAIGKYIGMLDADDIAYPEKFEEQIAFLEKNKDFGMVGSWAVFIDENGEKLPGSWKLTASSEMIPAIMLFKNYFLQSAVLYRKECISKFSFKEDFDILEDYLIWLEIIKKYKAWNLQKYLVKYRIHSGGVTKKHSIEKLLKEKKVFQLLFEQIGINATEEEMEMHLLIRDDVPITSISTLKSIESWLLKISEKNKELKIYNHHMLEKVIFNRWAKVCSKASGLHIKMLYHFFASHISTTFVMSFTKRKNN
jgi:glycosyltransferase involved in cell wall biosynthesis